MNFECFIISILLFNDVLGNSKNGKIDDFEESLNEHGKNHLEVLNKKILLYNALYQQTEWAFNRHCRWRVNNTYPSCVNKFTEKTTCFGHPIDYEFSSDHTDKLNFPNYLKIVENFPSCWEILHPLICAVHFRPCSIRKFIDDKPTQKVWQLFPAKFCYDAKKKCRFLIDAGLWPDELDCKLTSSLRSNETEETASRRRRILFDETNECKIQYSGTQEVGSIGCANPLIEVAESELKSKPIVDRCYFPCDSSFSNNVKVFRLGLCLFSLVMCALFSTATIYNLYSITRTNEKLESTLESKNAENLEKHHSMNFKHRNELLFFVRTMMFGSVALFWMLWAYSLGSQNLTSAACESSNNLNVRKVGQIDSFDWCAIQWHLLNALLISSYEWLTILIYLWCTPIKPEFLDKFELSNGINVLKTLVAVIVYINVFVISVFLLKRNDVTDGITNVCYNPIDTLSSNFFLYFILVLLAILSCGFLVPITRGYFKRSKPKSFIDEQHQEALIEEGQGTNSKVHFENVIQQSTFYSCLFTVLIFLFSVIGMIILHSHFEFNPTNEKSRIEDKLRCIYDHIKKLKSKNEPSDGTIPEYCLITQMTTLDFVHLFVYAFLLFILPFVCILIFVIFDLFDRKCGFWRIYENVTKIEIPKNKYHKKSVSKIEFIQNEDFNIKRPEYPKSETVSSVSRPETVPCDKSKKRRSKRQGKMRGKVLGSRTTDLNKHYVEHRQGYCPPYLKLRNSPENCAQSISSPTVRECEQFHQLNQQHNNDLANLYNQISILIERTLKSNQVQQTIAQLNYSQNQTTTTQNQTTTAQDPEPNRGKPVVEKSNTEDSDAFDSDESDSEEERRFNRQNDDESDESCSSLCTTQSSLFEEHEDDDYPTISMVVHLITKQAQHIGIEQRITFVQCAFEQFRNLFEKDPMFRKMCIIERQKDPINPGVKTLEENHLITVPEVLNLCEKLKEESKIKQVLVLCQEAINHAKVILKLDLPALKF